MGKGKRGPNMLGFVDLKAKDYEYESSSPNFLQKILLAPNDNTSQIHKITPS